MPGLRDNVSRTKASSPLGKSIFVGLRAADVFWQYNLLHRGLAASLITRLGGQAVSASQIHSPLAFTQLQPYYVLVTLLAAGSGIKQIAHMTLISEQEMPIGSALGIAAFNTVINSVNTLLAVWAVTSPISSGSSTSLSPSRTWAETLSPISSSPLITLGATTYLLGLLTETIAEFQRKSFKQDPSNKGKPYSGGLFSLATHINYGGYTLWRSGYALLCGGVAWGVATFAFFFNDFASRGVPVLEEYLVQRYGDEYKEIQEKVRYRLIPGIY